MPASSFPTRLLHLAWLAVVVTAWGCSGDGSSGDASLACDRTVEAGVHYAVEWQDSSGSCVTGWVMSEHQCERWGPPAIQIRLTDDGQLAPYNQANADRLWFERTDRTIAPLPSNVVDTGLSHSSRSLHIAADRQAAYVQTPTGIELWGRVDTGSCA